MTNLKIKKAHEESLKKVQDQMFKFRTNIKKNCEKAKKNNYNSYGSVGDLNHIFAELVDLNSMFVGA